MRGQCSAGLSFDHGGHQCCSVDGASCPGYQDGCVYKDIVTEGIISLCAYICLALLGRITLNKSDFQPSKVCLQHSNVYYNFANANFLNMKIKGAHTIVL